MIFICLLIYTFNIYWDILCLFTFWFLCIYKLSIYLKIIYLANLIYLCINCINFTFASSVYQLLCIYKLTRKRNSQTTPSLGHRPGNIFSTLCWQANPQLWHRVLKSQSLPIYMYINYIFHVKNIKLYFYIKTLNFVSEVYFGFFQTFDESMK